MQIYVFKSATYKHALYNRLTCRHDEKWRVKMSVFSYVVDHEGDN